MYKQKRLELSKKYKITRVPRYTLRDYRCHEGEAKYLVGKYNSISNAAVLKERKRISREFPNAVIDVNTYYGIDQGQNGACSMVAIFNALELHGHTKHFLKVPYGKVKRRWKKYWKPPMRVGHLDASSDLGEALDMLSHPLIKSHEGLIYMPLRSEDNREQCFNEEFWVNKKEMLISRFDIPSGEYEKIRHIYEIAYFIENQIDNGIPVVINVNEHCRVAIGYNATKILFADSWGNQYTQSNKSGSSVNMAGFSVDCKWMVYCWARDLVTFNASKAKFDPKTLLKTDGVVSEQGKKSGASTIISTACKTTEPLDVSFSDGNIQTISGQVKCGAKANTKPKKRVRYGDCPFPCTDSKNGSSGQASRSKETEVASRLDVKVIDLTCDDENFDIPLRERLDKKRRKQQ